MERTKNVNHSNNLETRRGPFQEVPILSFQESNGGQENKGDVT